MGRLKELLVQKLDAELASWKPFFKSQIKTRNFAVIDEAYTRDKLAGYTIYPEELDIFSAFALTAPEKAKVIIIGQDPYHGPYQAHGLAFSVRNGRPAQPSLVNIRREILSDIENAAKLEGCDLTPWARQGVLLLNSSLTVRAGSRVAGPHPGRRPARRENRNGPHRNDPLGELRACHGRNSS